MEISREQGVLIRGIAILMIVAYHFQYDMFGGTFLIDRGQGLAGWFNDWGLYLQQEPSAWLGTLLSLCFVGVNVFFVLSGYSLVKKYRERKKVKMSDMAKQIMKILIPFWIAHPVIHVVDWVLKNLQYQFGLINYETYFAGMHSIGQYVESMLVIPRWFSEEGALSFVGTWWFVGVIVQFYLLFPLILKLFKKMTPLRALSICVVTGLVYRYLVTVFTGYSPVGINEADILLFISFPARLPEFALGMYVAWQSDSLKRMNKSWIGLVLLALGFVLLSYEQTMFLSDFIFGLGGIILLYSITKIMRGPLKKAVSIIGKKSYGIYLYHEPTMKLILKFIFPNWINS